MRVSAFCRGRAARPAAAVAQLGAGGAQRAPGKDLLASPGRGEGWAAGGAPVFLMGAPLGEGSGVSGSKR